MIRFLRENWFISSSAMPHHRRCVFFELNVCVAGLRWKRDCCWRFGYFPEPIVVTSGFSSLGKSNLRALLVQCRLWSEGVGNEKHPISGVLSSRNRRKGRYVNSYTYSNSSKKLILEEDRFKRGELRNDPLDTKAVLCTGNIKYFIGCIFLNISPLSATLEK